MPDLKQYCKPCPNMDNELKPRKIINRLPDIDMWMVCNQRDVLYTQEQLIYLFNKYQLYTSDVDPLRTIRDVEEIVKSLREGKMPKKNLPIDAHIMDYETFYSLILKVPQTISEAFVRREIPYIPILPYSYRKKWQHDDMAYNFVHDYLYALTEYNFDEDLQDILNKTRKEIAENFSVEELYALATNTGSDSVKRRNETKILARRFESRVNSWKR